MHPDGKGDVTALRGKVATVAAAALLTRRRRRREARALTARRDGLRAPAPASSASAVAQRCTPVLTGIDVLAAEGFARLRGKRVGLLTNQTGRSRDGASTIDLLAARPGVTLVALFSPEHGIRGQLDEKVPSARDEKTGLPIHSLYGDTRRPTDGDARRASTRSSSICRTSARASTPIRRRWRTCWRRRRKRKLPVVVLDRPEPDRTASTSKGRCRTPSAIGFIGYLPMPIRHGMTLGELARLFNGEKKIGADLTVVPMKNWRRDDWFDDTGLTWVNPSPNMRNMDAATLYPGIGAIEGHEHLGRPRHRHAVRAARRAVDRRRRAGRGAQRARACPASASIPVTFTPAAGAKLGGQACHGVFMIVTDRDRLRPVRVGLEIAAALSRLYGAQFKLEDAAYAVRLEGDARKNPRRRRPGGDCRVVGAGRSRSGA